jgi:branched-chain amino acid transport system ATP-binding protein
MLEIRDLSVSIGPAAILRDVSFEVKDGAFHGLIGRNGAGKTTLMRALMGLIRSSGTVTFEGEPILVRPAHERGALGFGYMPEDRRLVPDFTVEENILLPVDALHIPDAPKRLEWIYGHMPEIVRFRERRAAALSGGQQKMVALARALIVGNRLLLLDEPFEGLAPALALRLADVLAGLKRDGVSILVAESHDVHLQGLLTDACRIERGRVSAN